MKRRNRYGPTYNKKRDLFLLTDQTGNITNNTDIQYGLYAKDTRFLSEYELFINHRKPIVLFSEIVENYINKIYLTNPKFKKVENEKVLIKRKQIIFNGTVYDRILIKNYFPWALELKLILKVDADYLDIFQVRNYVKEKRLGTILNPHKVKNGIVLGYLGKDGLKRETELKILTGEGEIYRDRINFLLN